MRGALFDSMKRNGFLWCCPIVTSPDQGLLSIIDGNNRFEIAVTLQLPVWYVVTVPGLASPSDLGPASTSWTLENFAEVHARNKRQPYVTLLAFAQKYELPTGAAAALLGGKTHVALLQPEFNQGMYKVRDYGFAQRVAELYQGLRALNPAMKGRRLLEACHAACLVHGFDDGRLLRKAKAARDKLTAMPRRDAYLDAFEAIYNAGNGAQLSIRFEARKMVRAANKEDAA
jgi:hypothetical protein